jgi:DNA polymerase IV
MRIILHLDMNSYFASVEQQARPELRGRSVGVCEHLGGIIIAPSVEAKRLGIKLGTTVWDARKICPGIVLLPTDPDKYRSVTERFMKILSDYSDIVERASIDEAFIDITPTISPPVIGGDEEGVWDDALMLALEIKQRMKLEIGEWVSCSIGIGPNRLIAKIAADLDGGTFPSVILEGVPTLVEDDDRISGDSIAALQNDNALLDRICVIRPDQVDLLYDILKLTDIPGIGERTQHALNRLGISTLRDLALYPVGNLLNQFGINGYFLHSLANFDFPFSVIPVETGIQARPRLRSGNWIPHQVRDDKIIIDVPGKSIGHMYTLPRETRDMGEIKGLIMKLAEKVGRRMRQHSARGNVVHYFHSGFGKQHKLGEYICDAREIYRATLSIFHQARLATPIKIAGISVSGFRFDQPQEPMFEEYKRPGFLTRAMDQINDKYGEYTIGRALLLRAQKEWAKDTVGFSRMK